VDSLTVSESESWLQSLFSEDVGRWFDFIELELGRGGLVDTSAFIRYLHDKLGTDRFEDLKIPLDVVATDVWSRQQVVFSSNELLPAIRASIAIPGLFEPVHYNGHVLVDGGLVNPVPYDLLFADCDIVIAVDVLGKRTPDSKDGPGYFENTFNTFQIMQASIMREKRRLRRPDIYLQPAIENVRVLEFYKAEEVYKQARKEKERLQRYLHQELL
jgi:NTE family protein